MSRLIFSWSSVARGVNGQDMICIPSHLYFTTSSNRSDTQRITVVNTGRTLLELNVFVGDWDYDPLGNERTFDAGTLKASIANWIRICPSPYLVLQAGERRGLEITLKTPAETDVDGSVFVRTAMISFARLNPAGTGTTEDTSVHAGIRPGVKVHHSFFQEECCDLRITDFKKLFFAGINSMACLELKFSVTGKLWVEGIIRTELLHMKSGTKIRMPNVHYYALPGDIRRVRFRIPSNMPNGRYIATALISLEKSDYLKMAETEFAIP